MKVIDDFLPDYHFDQIKKIMMGTEISTDPFDDHFPWYYNPCVTRVGDGRFQFTHSFYQIENSIPVSSEYYSLFNIVQQKLGVKKLRRIKANLNPGTFFHRKSDWHIDFPARPGGKTSILYMNTNNGWTEFKKGGKVKSVANRLVTFDSGLEHQGVTCTDEKIRVVINFNYEV